MFLHYITKGSFDSKKGKVEFMTKKQALLIALKHLYAFVDSAELWDDLGYQDYVEALKVYGYDKDNKL